MRHKAGLIIILALVASSTWAWAQSGGPSDADMAKAKELFQSAEALKQKGDALAARGDTAAARAEYALSARDYLQGYKLSKLPLFLYNLGSLYRLRGNRQWSIRCYRAFVDTKPDNAKDLKDALTFIAGLEKELSEGAEEADADPFIDPTGVCVLAEDAAAPAPDLSTDTTGTQPDGSDELAGTQGLGEPTDTPEAPSPGRGYRTAFWITGGVTAASITGAVIFMLQTNGYQEDKNDAITAYQQSSGMQLNADDACADAEGRAGAEAVVGACDSGKRAALISNIFQGVALVGVVAAGFFFYKGYMQKREPDQAPASATRITPVIGPSAIGAEFTLRF